MTHIHGGNPSQTLVDLGISQRPVIDFSVNVSPLGLPASVRAHWNSLMDAASRYPSEQGDGVVAFYEQKFQLPKDAVLPGNGSAPLFELAFRVTNLQSAVLFAPTFYEYERALRTLNADISYIPLSPLNHFSAPPPVLWDTYLDRADAIVFCSPNNPTGTVFDPEQLLQLADAHKDKLLFVDEAFCQFRNDWQDATLLQPDRLRKNLIVFHSLTKFYGLPGIRMGSMVSHPNTIDTIKRHQIPWMINSLAEQIAPLLLECTDEENALRQLMQTERRFIAQCIHSHKRLELFETPANFFLARLTPNQINNGKNSSLDDLLRHFLERGLFVRDCRNFFGIEGDYFRFSILNRNKNIRLCDALMAFDNE